MISGARATSVCDIEIKRLPAGSLLLLRSILTRFAGGGGRHAATGSTGSSSFRQDAVVNGEQRKLKTIGDTDLVVDIAQIVLDHLLGGAEFGGDFLVLITLHDQGNDTQFLLREAVDDAGTDHVVLADFDGNGIVLDPGVTARNGAHAIEQVRSGHVAEDNTVSTGAEIAGRIFARFRNHDEPAFDFRCRLGQTVNVGIKVGGADDDGGAERSSAMGICSGDWTCEQCASLSSTASTFAIPARNTGCLSATTSLSMVVRN